MIQKRPITLIELLISLGLTIALLASMMGFYFQTIQTQRSVDKAVEENFASLYAGYRLARVLPTTLANKPFYLEGNSLVFFYDNGTGRGPLFSVDVLGKLSLMPNGDLMLFTWPDPERETDEEPSVREELIHGGVQEVSYVFFSPETKTKPTDWHYGTKGIPAIIWMTLKLKGEKKMEYAFVLPNAGHPILQGDE